MNCITDKIVKTIEDEIAQCSRIIVLANHADYGSPNDLIRELWNSSPETLCIVIMNGAYIWNKILPDDLKNAFRIVLHVRRYHEVYGTYSGQEIRGPNVLPIFLYHNYHRNRPIKVELGLPSMTGRLEKIVNQLDETVGHKESNPSTGLLVTGMMSNAEDQEHRHTIVELWGFSDSGLTVQRDGDREVPLSKSSHKILAEHVVQRRTPGVLLIDYRAVNDSKNLLLRLCNSSTTSQSDGSSISI